MTSARVLKSDPLLQSKFLGRALRMLDLFGRFPVSERTRFPGHGVVNHDGAKVLFLGTADVYEGSQLRLRLDATCGPCDEPFLVVEATENNEQHRVVRRIAAYHVQEGSPVRRWALSEFDESSCTWFGYVHKKALIEETEIENLARFEDVRAKWLAIEAATESLIRELGPSWFTIRDPRPATIIEWPLSKETDASGLD